ncbi:hypothetical protein [Alteromonas halophila]|uniref:Uncharacterized protein n=1 Tax=Alteromonas halophila TaxID=516698 RepID=A0A918JJD2_9ALTE|nr:hypothetical protein [Alteromonas halophila]GGW84130.1 hypothetical protein GCM10007391_17290 [Alteromonas halophila]
MKTSFLTIYNPIFYDLGGVFTPSDDTVERVDTQLRQSFEWQPHHYQYEYMAYNFSYLALHIPKLVYAVGRQTITVLGVDVEVTLNLSVRMSGNACFEYRYHIDDAEAVDIEKLVEALQCYINLSYTRYLKRTGDYKNAMKRIAQPDMDEEVPAILDHCELLEKLRLKVKQLKDFVSDSYCYPYQHGRLLYVCHPDATDIRHSLTNEGFKSTAVSLDNGHIMLGTWKTILTGDEEKQATFLNLYTDSLSRFFQCQGWIFQCEHRLNKINETLDDKNHSYTLLNHQAKDIESFYFTCNREMINFNNLSIPFKNDDYTFLSKSINDAIKLEGHISQTYKHLDAVKEHINLAKLYIDSRTEKHAKFLKLLMGLNLSAGIASLIPASLDGDIAKISSSMLPPIVWVTFALIAFTVLLVEFRKRS